MESKRIEVIDRGAEICEHTLGVPRKVSYLVSGWYQGDVNEDGQGFSFAVDGPCVAYLPDGILADLDTKWGFYNSDGEKVSEVDKNEIGQSVTVDCSGRWYNFDNTPGLNSKNGGKLNVGVDYFRVNFKGEKVPFVVGEVSHGAPVEDLFSTPDGDECEGWSFRIDRDQKMRTKRS